MIDAASPKPGLTGTLDRWHQPLLIAIGVVAVVLAAWARWGHSLGVDEPFTAMSARLPIAQLLADTWVHDNTPLTYLILKPWSNISGSSEMALRAPFLLAYGLAVVVTGLAARAIAGTPAGLFAALMVACSGRLGLLHAAAIRPYALLCAVSAVSTWMLVRADRTSPFRVVPFVAVQLFGLFAHPTYVFVVAAVAITALLIETRGRALRIAGASAAAVLVYLVSWGPILAGTLQLPATRWMSPPRADDLWQGYLFLWGNRTGFILVGAFIALVIVATRDERRAVRDDVRVRFAVGVAGLTLLLPFLASFAKPVFLFSRTPILVLPAVAVALAAVLARLGNTSLLAALSATFLLSLAQYVADSRRAGDPSPTRQSLEALLGEARCGDVLLTGGLAYLPVVYYLEQLQAPECLVAAPFPASMHSHPGWLDEEDFQGRRAEHALELARVVDETRSRPGSRLYVFGKRRGIGAPVYGVMVDTLDRQLGLEDAREWRGSFFDVIRVYRSAAATSPADTPR